ncbi:hypothetical protein CsatA_020614 [Cannabis sativa]
MAGTISATIGEEVDSLLSTFDHIQEDFKSALMEIQRLKSNSNGEIKKREALELACKSLKQELGNTLSDSHTLVPKLIQSTEADQSIKALFAYLNDIGSISNRVFCHLAENERLVKLYTESLNNVVDQERRKIEESVKQEYAKKISDLETQIRGLVLEKATREATLNQLRQDLGAHKSHIQYLAGRLERVNLNIESKYEIEIRGLRDCINNEQEEKRELNNKLQQLERELWICRSKIVKQQPNLTSDVHNETLQKTTVEPRKENKTLKRKLVKTERE